MNSTDVMKSRYTTKKFDSGKSIPEETIRDIENLLRLTPSSTNIQPWKFVLALTSEGKARIAKAASGFYSYNEPKILNASAVVVFSVRETIDAAYLEKLLAQEKTDGRFNSDKAMSGQREGRAHFVNLHRFERKDTQQWMEKQVYLAVGTLLFGVAALGLDACPMEGFDSRILDEELGLRTDGYSSSVIVSLGYRSKDDFNAALPKSRLPEKDVLIRI
ncbi:MAG: oxygen-insensitive NAD(P)H nitroreductase [Treponema sp.]|nr:oxygen-insensitive NAD(P)H nitroreductase [Treponema sp.]